jgi:hypothetical protein
MSPVSWEQPPRVLVGILHTELVTFNWSLGFRNLQLPPGSDIFPIAGRPFDDARNQICAAAIQNGFDHVLFLDSDVIPPSNAVHRLLSHNQPLMSALYCRRSPPHAVPVMMRHGQWITNFPRGKVVEADVVGTGCMLLSCNFLKEAAEKCPIAPQQGKTWFHWRSDMAHLLPPGQATSEDFSACLWWKEKLGIRILVDSSVVCLHVGLAEAADGTFVPSITRTHT